MPTIFDNIKPAPEAKVYQARVNNWSVENGRKGKYVRISAHILERDERISVTVDQQYWHQLDQYLNKEPEKVAVVSVGFNQILTQPLTIPVFFGSNGKWMFSNREAERQLKLALKAQEEPKARVQAYVPRSVRNRLETLSDATGKSVSELLGEAIAKLLD